MSTSQTDNRNATIDLTLCTPDLAKNTTIVTGPYWGSDHLPVIIEPQLNITTNTQALPTWKFDDSKWQEWNQDLENLLKGKNFKPNQSCETIYNNFYAALMETSNTHFTYKKKTSPGESQKPWWTIECHIATKNARKAFKTWRSTLMQEDKTYLNKMEAIKKRTILAEKNRSWERHIDTLYDGNASKFWKFSKAMMNGRRETTNTPLNNRNGEPIIDPLEMANIFLEQFSPLGDATTALNPEQEEEIEASLQNAECDPLNTELSLQELSRSILHIPDNAMDLDRIHNRILKNLSANNRKNLLDILNLMFKQGYVPKDWKCAIVTPILKPNKPISLTSCLGKTFEKND